MGPFLHFNRHFPVGETAIHNDTDDTVKVVNVA